VLRAFAQRGDARFGLVVRDEPRRVASDRDDARPAESVLAHANRSATVIVTRTVNLADPLARANVVEALQGPGGPVGVIDLAENGTAVTVRFDDAVTAPDIIDDLIVIESVFVPGRSERELALDEAAAIAAAGLGDPELDVTRIIETYVGELDAKP